LASIVRDVEQCYNSLDLTFHYPGRTQESN
jgi:hypothetical protein